MGLSELTGLPRRKCKDVLQCKEVLKHRGTENTEEGGGSRRRESYKRVLLKHGLREPCYGTKISGM